MLERNDAKAEVCRSLLRKRLLKRYKGEEKDDRDDVSGTKKDCCADNGLMGSLVQLTTESDLN